MGDLFLPLLMQDEVKKRAAALENWMAPLFDKLPHLPANIRELLVSIAPWLALIGGILGLFGVWSAGMLSAFFAFSFVGGGSQMAWMIALVVALAASILELMAYGPLSARKKRGWNLLFYATVLTTAASVIQILIAYGSLGSLLGALVGFWLLFEIRGLYQ